LAAAYATTPDSAALDTLDELADTGAALGARLESGVFTTEATPAVEIQVRWR